MTELERAIVKSRILKLSRLKATGRPVELARRLDISERTVKRWIKELKEEGYSLVYDFYSMSYVLKKKDENK
jgi:DNA-binding Lrp family transcriptional regulator